MPKVGMTTQAVKRLVKKLRKLKDELDKVHEKEDDFLYKIDEVIDELEDDGGGELIEIHIINLSMSNDLLIYIISSYLASSYFCSSRSG